MQVLDWQSLMEAMVKCHDNPRYKVEVFINSCQDLQDIIRELISVNHSTPIQGVEQITSDRYSGRVLFKNGSIIEFIFPESQFYSGVRCHDVLWDEVLQEMYPSEISQIAYSMIIKYHGKPSPVFRKPKDWTDDVETEEIDEFLSSFAIR